MCHEEGRLTTVALELEVEYGPGRHARSAAASERTGDLRRAVARGEHLRRHLADAFNVLDVLLCALMALLLVSRQANAIAPASSLASLALPCQALLALVAWLRLMQASRHP